MRCIGRQAGRLAGRKTGWLVGWLTCRQADRKVIRDTSRQADGQKGSKLDLHAKSQVETHAVLVRHAGREIQTGKQAGTEK